jgi:hypothetical protein
MLIKRLTAGLSGLAIAGILILGCENMDGPSPYLSKPLLNNQLVLISSAAQGSVPLNTIMLDSIKVLVVNDEGVFGFMQEDTEAPSIGVVMDEMGKIIFQ